MVSALVLLGRQGPGRHSSGRTSPGLCGHSHQPLLMFGATLNYQHASRPSIQAGPTQQRISSAFKTLQKRPHTPLPFSPHSGATFLSPPPAHPQKSFPGPVLNSCCNSQVSFSPFENDPKDLWFVSKSLSQNLYISFSYSNIRPRWRNRNQFFKSGKVGVGWLSVWFFPFPFYPPLLPTPGVPSKWAF